MREVQIIDCLRIAPPQGLVLEFGVAAGRSLREIARHSAGTVYGFDCWSGLPHDWGEGDPKGSFACEKPQVPGNVILVDGLFSDTLEPFLRDHDGPVGFCHIDCDLYCAARYVLDCLCDRFVVGSVVMFDEIAQDPQHGERLAFSRYRANNPNQHWEMIGKQHPWGEVYRLLDV